MVGTAHIARCGGGVFSSVSDAMGIQLFPGILGKALNFNG